MEIKQSYDPRSPECQFQYVFYNKVAPGKAPNYKAPELANKRLWRQAEINNPDPNTLVPTLAVGFEDLKKDF